MPREQTSLASQQAALMALVTGRDLGASAADSASLVVGDARASAADRVHVYFHMYRARIAEALESQFPRLARWLGAEEFGDVAAAYISDEPSRHPSLRYVGERLPAWLAARRRDAPALAGLAALEWARADVFDLVDETPLTMDDVRGWAADRFGELPLRLVTAHRVITVPAGTSHQWDALGADVAFGAPANAGTEPLVVWREGTMVYHRVVDDAERAALELAQNGTQFGVLCDSLLAVHGEEEAITKAYKWMSTWITDGLLRRFADST
jgi:hypothetical protein